MMNQADDLFATLEGRFYRAVDPRYLASALDGSRQPGRYSAAHQPTLYLSSTPEGVEAAMKAHMQARAEQRQIVAVNVIAHHIFDLRDAHRRAIAGISLNDAIADWQGLVTKGQRPSSWDVRNRLVSLGAKGMIDPSRKSPALWHLVLFDWNTEGAPIVQRA